MSILNITKQFLNLKRVPILLGKIWTRLIETLSPSDNSQNLRWLSQHKEDFAQYAASLDSGLWEESLVYAEQLEQHSQRVLSQLNVTLGGGGFYPLIFFVTRYMQPKTIVETGVAAGYSSHAFLTALSENNVQSQQQGELFSSDFPYFRLDNPEKYIGILVPEELQEHWHLFIDGDAKNLPQILSKVEWVDLFHYDSDKRYAGRQQAMELIKPKLSPNALVIMDDINDNAFFMELCKSSGQPFKIFEFGGKYIGMLGELKKAH